MEQKVFLEMSPVAGERQLTDEELAEVRRRAARPPRWFLVRLLVGLFVGVGVYSFAFIDVVRVKVIAVSLGNLLALVGIGGAFMLWRAWSETKLLAEVDEKTVVYRFVTNGHWQAYNLPTFMYPPQFFDVMYPSGLAIRSGGPLLRVFRPMPLVIIDDLPEAPPGSNSRQLTELERIEIDKHLKRYVKERIWALALIPMAIAAFILEVYDDDGWPSFLTVVIILYAPIAIGSIWSNTKRITWLRKIKDGGRVTVEWANDVSTEWLAVGELEWREGGEPARWRKHSGNGFSR